jgi:hypothetical protein
MRRAHDHGRRPRSRSSVFHPATPTRARGRTLPKLVLVTALLGSAGGLVTTASTPSPAAAAPCAALNKTIGGLFRGDDQRRLSGEVGVLLMDAQGHYLDAEGCVSDGSQYTFVDEVNFGPDGPLLQGRGVVAGDTSYEGSWEVTGAPANATTMVLETYPAPSDFPDRPYLLFGGAMRRDIPADQSGDVLLPRTCYLGLVNGEYLTGDFDVRAFRDGQPADVVSVTAVSRAAEGYGRTLGFVTAFHEDDHTLGSVYLEGLAVDQRYALYFALSDGSGYWYEPNFGSGIVPGGCQAGFGYEAFDLDPNGYAYAYGIGPVDGSTGPTAPDMKRTRTHDMTSAYQPVTGDFRGIGRSDILWYSPTGADFMWRSMGDGNFVGEDISISGSLTPLVGDFDGNGHDDIYWFSPTDGDALYRGTDTGFTATYPNSNGDFTGHVGDYNGDGRDVIDWFSPTGGDAIYYGTPTGFTATQTLLHI